MTKMILALGFCFIIACIWLYVGLNVIVDGILELEGKGE